jgi:serine/threonine protein kinase
MTQAYNFERDVLTRCRSKHMDRIVAALDDGSVQVTTPMGLETVQYIIFERADGDSRSFMSTSQAFDSAWALRCLHHVSTGLVQLHRHDIAHQDLKPSNVLVFEGTTSKVGDMGRAAYKGHQPPHEGLEVPGDRSYAPPELLYHHIENDWQRRRFGCDVYLLGSMVLFFFMDASATAAILAKMQPSHHPNAWTSTYVQVLPYVRDAFNKVIDELGLHAPELFRDDLQLIFRQLCEPDPSLRGHPRDRAGIGSPLSLQRYVSHFDRLASKAEYELR